ncbi:transposase, partial [Dietzia cinnamea]
AHARVEDRIRHAKDTGLGRLPSREFALNQAWLVAVMIAADLVAWTRMLACTGAAQFWPCASPKRCATASSTWQPDWSTAAAGGG